MEPTVDLEDIMNTTPTGDDTLEKATYNSTLSGVMTAVDQPQNDTSSLESNNTLPGVPSDANASEVNHVTPENVQLSGVTPLQLYKQACAGVTP